jgi:hypothetical protein
MECAGFLIFKPFVRCSGFRTCSIISAAVHMFVLSAWLASGFTMADGKQLELAAPPLSRRLGTRRSVGIFRALPGQHWSARASSGNFLTNSAREKKGTPWGLFTLSKEKGSQVFRKERKE